MKSLRVCFSSRVARIRQTSDMKKFSLMKYTLISTSKLLLALLCAFVAHESARAQGETSANKPSAQAKKSKSAETKAETTTDAGDEAARQQDAPASSASDEESLKAELDAIKDLPFSERISRLEAFLAANPQTSLRARAWELLAVSRATLGSERLNSGDRLGGTELFRQIVGEVGPETSDRFFVEIVLKLPGNLFMLGHRDEGAELARLVEEKAKDNPVRLLSVASLYLAFELPEDAARVSEEAVRVAPDSAAARQALGGAERMSLKLESSARNFARAHELDPASRPTRRSLADLLRATGKSEEALTHYRELAATDASDAGARAGLVLSLFDAGRDEEAEAELKKALADQPENLPLLVGASLHFSSREDGARALDLAERAVRLEPRSQWVWARLAYARALRAGKRPLDAERAVRLARELGRFPTLSYELAAALADAGLYEEAAEELSESFTIKDGRIETYLAGRTLARAEDFLSLLAPERRASTFHHRATDSEQRARILKGLLAFHLATRSSAERVDARAAVEAARDFTSGDDELRAFRNLYVAAKLLARDAAHAEAVEQTNAAMSGVDAASASPLSVMALLADEMREGRARARTMNVPVETPVVPRDLLSKILRGRIEELAGQALYQQGNASEAVVRLRRAVSVLPENSYWWRNAEWRLGAALEASGEEREALAAYILSYRLAPDAARRPIIEALYRRLNKGSDAGLERLLAPQSVVAAAGAGASTATPQQPFTISKRPPDESAEIAAALKELTDAKPDATDASAAKTETTERESAAADDEERAAKTETQPVKAEERNAPAETQPAPLWMRPVPSENSAGPVNAAKPSPELKEPAEERTQTAPAEEPTRPEPTDSTQTAPVEAAREERAERKPEEGEVAKDTDAPAPVTRHRIARNAPASSRTIGEGATCSLQVKEDVLSMNAGGSAVLTVALEGSDDFSRIKVSTLNWAHIVIFMETRNASDVEAKAQRFTISSVSGSAGRYVAVVESACGKREVEIEVK